MSDLPPFCDELRFDRGCTCNLCMDRQFAITAKNVAGKATSSTAVTPILPAKAPAARLPIGAMPINDIV